MRALDTSVTVPALTAWHEAHEVVVEALDPGDRLTEHGALETYSVLSRLPPPLRLTARAAAGIVTSRFPGPRLELARDRRVGLLERLADAEVTGGAVYDALIGLTAHAHGAVLLTRDDRAITTYDRLGVAYQRV